MGEQDMTDRDPLIRDAFREDSLPEADRDRLWKAMQDRSARQARLRFLVRAGALLLAGSVVAAGVILRNVIRSPSDRRLFGPVAVAADSISTDSSVERPMIQETQHEVPSNLIPLLGHRSEIRTDMQNLENRQLQLADRLDETTGREHDVVVSQLASVEQQLEASKVALRAIDAQLAGQPVASYAVAETPPPQLIQVNPPLSDEAIWAAGGPAILLALGMIAMLGYMRRIARKTREALAAIEGQVSSQHATLASGIDAIAVEVERLGEGQRFMSKVLSGSEAKLPLRNS